jgi:cell division GTPase FtsZ
MLKLSPKTEKIDPVIKILGVGRAGCNVLKGLNVENIEKIFLVNDLSLSLEPADDFSLSIMLTSKLNSFSGIKNSGYLLAKDNDHLIRPHLKGADIIFIIAGLGGDTGGGVSQYISEILKEQKTLSIGLFSMPFSFEGVKKSKIADNTYLKLHKLVDSLITIENDSLLNQTSFNKPKDLFFHSTDAFQNLILGLVTLLRQPTLFDVALSDVITTMENMGKAAICSGISSGENRAYNAINSAFRSLLVDSSDLKSAHGFIVNITSSDDMTIDEFEFIANSVKNFCSDSATVVIAPIIDTNLVNHLRVTVIISGLPELHKDYVPIDDVEISRTIEFSPENMSAGLSILSYFDQVLKQKYEGIVAAVRIEQSDNAVRLVIQTNNGDIQTIEKTLSDFGRVVKGELNANQFLNNRLDIERLNMKLEMASMELRHNQKIISLYESEQTNYKRRIESLESQLINLQNSLGDSLIKTQNNLNISLTSKSNLVSSVMELIKDYSVNGFTKSDELTLKSKIEEVHHHDKSAISELESLIKNTLYGVSGNSVFMFVQSLIQSLPK